MPTRTFVVDDRELNREPLVPNPLLQRANGDRDLTLRGQLRRESSVHQALEASQLDAVLPWPSQRNGRFWCIKSCLLTNQNRLPEPRAREDALNPKYRMMKVNAIIAITTIGLDESSDPSTKYSIPKSPSTVLVV